MLSKFRTVREGYQASASFDYDGFKEIFDKKFHTGKPKDVIDMFKDVSYSCAPMVEIQRTVAARKGAIAHQKTMIGRDEYDSTPFSGIRMFVADCCGRKDDHFCGALHHISSNSYFCEDHINCRPQQVSRRKIFIPCGIKALTLETKEGKTQIIGTKFRRCMCNEPIMTAASIVGVPSYVMIGFCSKDYLQVIANPDRKYRKCGICNRNSTSFEVNGTWVGGPDMEEHFVKNDLCIACAPIRHIYAMLSSKGYLPVHSQEEYERKRVRWMKSTYITPTSIPYSAFISSNHTEINMAFRSMVLNNDPKLMINLKNSTWMKDLTTEGIEPNPGPVDSISLLNQHAQKNRNNFPTYESEPVIDDYTLNYKITCYYMMLKTEAISISKKAAKHEAALKMLHLIAN